MMKARPILFSGSMVRALLNGSKRQTRRVMKPQPDSVDSSGRWYAMPGGGQSLNCYDCPYGQPGDLLWVRETLTAEKYASLTWNDVAYAADNTGLDDWPDDWSPPWNTMRTHQETGDNIPCGGFDYYTAKVPSIFMPRWASRLTLRITDVQAQRLQEITLADARSEGVELPEQFVPLWDSINAKRGHGWEVNPWVWALTFKVINRNVDDVLSESEQH